MYQSLASKLKQVSILTVATFFILGLYFARSHTAPGSTDSYWHLSLGRQIWEQKSIPNRDQFIYGSLKNEFYLNRSTEWLSSLLMYIPVKFFGLKFVYLERIFFGIGIIFLVFLTLKVFTDNNLLIITALVFLGYAMPSRLALDRVENFSLLFLAFINYVCFHQYFKKRLSKLAYLLPLIFLAWPNMHPFVVVGYAMLFFWVISIAESGFEQKSFNKNQKLFFGNCFSCPFNCDASI